MRKSLFIAAALLSLAACAREVAIDTCPGEMTITARTETAADTRTVVEGETHVYWEPGDEIKVFAGGKSGKFTTDITASSPSASFNGSLGDDAWTEGMDLWAVYPYSKDATFDGETITTTLPSEQIARFGSFGKDMNLSIAHSANNNLQFYNVGGGIRFRLTQEGIKRVTFEGYDGEFLAGKVKIGLDENGLPQIRELTDGSKVITLLPPSGNDSFPTNVWFYCVAIPGSLASGYKLEFYRESEYSRMASEKAVTIKRSIFGSIDNADEGCVFIPIPDTIATPEAIDLGLPSGLKWASFNLGATKPEEWGDFYAWGEIEPYYEDGLGYGQSGNEQTTLPIWKSGKEAGYDWSSYKWSMGASNTLTKYCPTSEYGYNGFTDNKVILDGDDDAAHVILGDKWRMFTVEEYIELIECCSRVWTTENGVNGCRFTSKINGNSIFLPAAGLAHEDLVVYNPGRFGYYWSSSLVVPEAGGNGDPNYAFYASVSEGEGGTIYAARLYGMSIRPVYGDPKPVTPSVPVPDPVDLGLPSGLKWASFNLGASASEEHGDYYAWGETEPYYSSLDLTKWYFVWKDGKVDGYSWTSYKWFKENSLTKYCTNSDDGYNGFTDDKSVLDPEDDAAHVNLGGSWRMPTDAEWTELRENCTWEWITRNGVTGHLVSANNGNSIFLPAAGEFWGPSLVNKGDGGQFWSSSLDTASPGYAWCVSVDSVSFDRYRLIRCYGLPIRPVCE